MNPSELSEMARAIVYIDGLNLYYGAIRGGPHKWLDLEKYCRMIRQADQIERIYYFTSLVNGDPQRARQQVYLKALAISPDTSIILGKFKHKRVECTVAQCTYSATRRFKCPEEKRTDVNIAVQMLDDAYQDACDLFILVSGDSDLVPVVQRVKSRFPQKRILVYVPSRDPNRGAAYELRGSADEHRDLPLSLLKHAQFSKDVPDGADGIITKPPEW